MTSSERQRRFLARLREQRPAELHVRVTQLRLYPVEISRWLCRQLGPDATRALRDALDQALAGGSDA